MDHLITVCRFAFFVSLARTRNVNEKVWTKFKKVWNDLDGLSFDE